MKLSEIANEIETLEDFMDKVQIAALQGAKKVFLNPMDFQMLRDNYYTYFGQYPKKDANGKYFAFGIEVQESNHVVLGEVVKDETVL